MEELETFAIQSTPETSRDFAAKFLTLKEIGLDDDLGRVLELDAMHIMGKGVEERELEAIHTAWAAIGDCINSKVLDEKKADELYKVSADLEGQAAKIPALTARALALKIQLCDGELNLCEGALAKSTWQDIERLGAKGGNHAP